MASILPNGIGPSPARPSAVALAWLLLGVGAAAYCDPSTAAESPPHPAPGCATEVTREAAKDAFADGIVAFERKQWLIAQVHFLRALAFGCSEKLDVVVPYGRWSYEYAPDLYLGLTLQRLGCCVTPEGRRCSIADKRWRGGLNALVQQNLEKKYPDDWAEALVDFPSLNACGKSLGWLTPTTSPLKGEACAVMPCVTVRGSAEVYCPVIDWWIKLRKIPSRHDSPAADAAHCESATTPFEWFSRALSLGDQDVTRETNEWVCKTLLENVVVVGERCNE